jgi:hypothetical protein
MPVKSKHQQKYNANPTGKGGFGDRPWTINRTGRWNPADSYPEQLRRYFRMTAAQLDEEAKKDGLTTAQMMALTAIKDAMMLEGKARIDAIEKLSDRIDGRPLQAVEQSVSVAAPPQITVEFPDDNSREIEK